MATLSRDLTVGQVGDNSELSDEEIKGEFKSENDPDKSDIDIEGLESSSETRSDSKSVVEDEDDKGIAWSQKFQALTFEDFSGTPGIKVAVPNEPKAKFSFNLVFGDQIVNLIVRETNRYAQQKLVNKPAMLKKWQDITGEELTAYFGLCIIMGINSLHRIAMYWSSDSFIGNSSVHSVMTKKYSKQLPSTSNSAIQLWNHSMAMQTMISCIKFVKYFQVFLKKFKQFMSPPKAFLSMKE